MNPIITAEEIGAILHGDPFGPSAAKRIAALVDARTAAAVAAARADTVARCAAYVQKRADQQAESALLWAGHEQRNRPDIAKRCQHAANMLTDAAAHMLHGAAIRARDQSEAPATAPAARPEPRAPVQADRKYGAPSGTIAWSEHVRAWGAYATKYGEEQSATRMAERGGFSYGELVMFLGREPTTWKARDSDPPLWADPARLRAREARVQALVEAAEGVLRWLDTSTGLPSEIALRAALDALGKEGA